MRSVLTRTLPSGKIIARLLIVNLVLLLGGCATTSPITNTSGAVESLMKDDNYPAVRSASPAIRAWAKKALNYVNDLSYELQTERNK